MKRLLFIALMLSALCAGAQQLQPYEHIRENRVMSTRAEQAMFYLGIPTGATPYFPAYVPDSVKCKAVFKTTGSNSLYSKGIYYYDCDSGLWQKSGVDFSLAGGLINTGTAQNPIITPYDLTPHSVGMVGGITPDAGGLAASGVFLGSTLADRPKAITTFSGPKRIFKFGSNIDDSKFFIARYDDAGNFIDNASEISRATGAQTFNHSVYLHGDAVEALEPITKNQFDNYVTGITWKQEVRAATTGNITLSGTQTVDGVALVANDRVLVFKQTNASQNGIYLVKSTAWIRSVDADASEEIASAAALVRLGTVNKNTQWTCTNITDPIIGTDAITFGQLSGAGTYTNGTGLTLTANVFDINYTTLDARYVKLINKNTFTGDVTNTGSFSIANNQSFGILNNDGTAYDVSITNKGLILGNKGSVGPADNPAYVGYNASEGHIFTVAGSIPLELNSLISGVPSTAHNYWKFTGRTEVTTAPVFGNDIVRLVDIVNTSVDATDANFSTNINTIFTLPAITANRTITFDFPNGSPSFQGGKMMRFWNKNTSPTYNWSFGGSYLVKDVAGNTVTALVNNAFYTVISNGTDWVTQSVQYNYTPANNADLAGYASLTGSYANPSWITSLAYSKLTGVPNFALSATTLAGYGITDAVINTRTVAGFALSGNITLASLTATDATLTLSGTYNGSIARTVGLNLGNANIWTGTPTIRKDNIGAGIGVDGINLENSTAGTVSVSQISPSLHFKAYGWATGVNQSQAGEWRITGRVNTNTGTVSPYLDFERSVNGGAYASAMQLFPNIFSLGAGYFLSNRNTIGTVSTDGQVASNTTAATSGVPVQISPRMRWTGTTWNTSGTPATNQLDAIAELVPVSGTSPTSYLRVGFQSSGGGYTYPFYLRNNGDLEFLNISTGPIVRSPNGTKWRITANDAGAAVVTSVP